MIDAFLIMLSYEVKVITRQPFAWLTPLLFFVIVVCLFPLAIGHDQVILANIAPGAIWVAALLAILLSFENVFKRDASDGYIDAMLLGQYPVACLVLIKVLAHWLVYCLPLVLISPLLAVLLHVAILPGIILAATLLLGTPVLSLLGAVGAALSFNITGNSLLLPILIMPLYIPVLIFGTSAAIAGIAALPVSGYFAILAALGLITLSFTPYLTSLALRVGVNQ